MRIPIERATPVIRTEALEGEQLDNGIGDTLVLIDQRTESATPKS